MQQFYTMAGVQGVLFLYMAVGYGANKCKLLSRAVRAGLTELLLYVLLPCMVFDSFQQELSFSMLKTGAATLAAAFFLCLVAWVVGLLLWRRFPPERRVILRYGTLIANSGFAGLPVVQGAYGAEGLFLASIFIIANRILMWSAGISLFSRNEKTDWVRHVLLNPGIIAVFLGLGWSLLKLPLPGFIATAIAAMGDCTAPLSLMVVGAILADVDWRRVLERDVLLASLVRLLLLPLLALIMLRAVGFGRLGTAVAVILTAMPIGSTTAILAEKYGADALFASKCIFVSTLLSMVITPFLAMLL